MVFHLVRHGQTVFNAALRVQGRLDSELTELGRAQARGLGEALRQQVDPATIVITSSPQGRARATAEILRASLGAVSPIGEDDRLREISLGRWEGMTQAEIEERWPGQWRGTVRRSWVETCPDGEPYDAAVARLSAWLDDARRGPDQVVISHGVSIGILRGLYLGLSQDEILSYIVPQGVIWVFADGEIRTLS